jgi:hypothetical protein
VLSGSRVGSVKLIFLGNLNFPSFILHCWFVKTNIKIPSFGLKDGGFGLALNLFELFLYFFKALKYDFQFLLTIFSICCADCVGSSL